MPSRAARSASTSTDSSSGASAGLASAAGFAAAGFSVAGFASGFVFAGSCGCVFAGSGSSPVSPVVVVGPDVGVVAVSYTPSTPPAQHTVHIVLLII